MSRPAFEQTTAPWRGTGFYIFRVGTVHGLYRYNLSNHSFDILAIKNEEKGNGHFQEAMRYFEESAARERAKLRLCEVWNMRLYYNSVKHHGYKRVKGTLFTLEKTP